ncbi:type II secretion system minor pseudopilin GspK [Roseateles violae]|uniref:Type II secretion system protein K n=1 Tax=Roseateles violae TaxID=3058042 RepID=A0ABT8DXA7_9BURK|nr:type II secretion system minor pseudopilin GspK [Pelomonas sp. PFR6]MDN3921151.1 type II secretion system minor pseudopilin GspK [Pelomonas sp. PFR6]
MSHLATRQRGAALLVAMIIVSLVATLAAAMVWRQYRAVQIEAAERARAQAGWILQGALDWARLILREDARASANLDHLGEVWAVPLAEARLSTFLAAEQARGGDSGGADDGPEAFLSGSMEDAQARYNLRLLLGGEQVPAQEQRVLERLCEIAGAPRDTASRIISGLRSAFDTQAAREGQPLPPQDIEQLAWFGLDADTIARLRPLLILLPTATPVNLNTAPREVIAALFEGMDLASAERLVQARQQAPLTQPQAAKSFLPEDAVISSERVSVQSSHFIVSGRLRLDGRVLEDRSLVRRRGLEITVLERQHINRMLEP